MERRKFLKSLGTGLAATAALATPASSAALFGNVDIRGSVDAAQSGARPGALDDQSRVMQKIFDQAAREDKPVFLPPGTYLVSNLTLPPNTRLMGISGASRLIYGGEGHLLMAEHGQHIEISDIVIDGANRTLRNGAEALVQVMNCKTFVLNNCEIVGSSGSGVHLERCGGRIEKCRITGASGLAAIYSVDSFGMTITNNEVSDCANGGILIHRWQPGEDGSIVMGNRIQRIHARNGGTGQWGNGVNIFRAHSVMVANNRIADCAFSAVRSNSGSNAQIIGNNCSRSGETALYSEFEFEGAMIANNIVDGATIGVSIANFMQSGRMAVCANNIIRNLKTKGPYPAQQPGFGIGISVEADTTVTGNLIENAPLYGMLLGWGPYLRDVVASGNVIRNAREGIAVSVVKGAGKVNITGNIISQSLLGNIVGHEWADAVTKDLALVSSHPFDHLMLEKNTVSS